MTAGGAMVLWRFGPIWYRQVTAHNGEKSPWKKYVYWNPGFLLFLGLCLLEMIVYLFEEKLFRGIDFPAVRSYNM